MNRRTQLLVALGAIVLVSVGATTMPRGDEAPVTPPDLVASYDTLADAILAVKHTEANLVRSILATTYAHAELAMARAVEHAAAGSATRQEIENLSTLVAQLGNEGDTAVAGVRKRLLEGGHHHNAAGEQQGVFDEGFVIVTRAAKQVFLDAARKMAATAGAPDAAVLKAEWNRVKVQWTELIGS